MKRLLIYILFSIIFLSCKGQENGKGLIDTKVTIDKIYSSEDYIYKSSILDNLFKIKDGLYMEGDGNGARQTEEFHCAIIGLFNKEKKRIKSYALFFDKKDILRDTLSIGGKDISLDVIFAQNKKGIALGKMDLENSYFKISDLYEVTPNTLKLKKIDLETKIKKCQIPVDYITEEYVGLEDYFSFGIKSKTIESKLCSGSFQEFLERNESSPEGIVSSIFTKDKKSNLKIDVDLLDCISKTTTKENSIYLSALENYAQKSREDLGWSLEEHSKIKAYIFNTSYPLRKKYWSDKYEEWYDGKPEVFLGDRGEWRENNNYDLPNLGEYVRQFLEILGWEKI